MPELHVGFVVISQKEVEFGERVKESDVLEILEIPLNFDQNAHSEIENADCTSTASCQVKKELTIGRQTPFLNRMLANDRRCSRSLLRFTASIANVKATNEPVLTILLTCNDKNQWVSISHLPCNYFVKEVKNNNEIYGPVKNKHENMYNHVDDSDDGSECSCTNNNEKTANTVKGTNCQRLVNESEMALQIGDVIVLHRPNIALQLVAFCLESSVPRKNTCKGATVFCGSATNIHSPDTTTTTNTAILTSSSTPTPENEPELPLFEKQLDELHVASFTGKMTSQIDTNWTHDMSKLPILSICTKDETLNERRCKHVCTWHSLSHKLRRQTMTLVWQYFYISNSYRARHAKTFATSFQEGNVNYCTPAKSDHECTKNEFVEESITTRNSQTTSNDESAAALHCIDESEMDNTINFAAATPTPHSQHNVQEVQTNKTDVTCRTKSQSDNQNTGEKIIDKQTCTMEMNLESTPAQDFYLSSDEFTNKNGSIDRAIGSVDCANTTMSSHSYNDTYDENLDHALANLEQQVVHIANTYIAAQTNETVLGDNVVCDTSPARAKYSNDELSMHYDKPYVRNVCDTHCVESIVSDAESSRLLQYDLHNNDKRARCNHNSKHAHIAKRQKFGNVIENSDYNNTEEVIIPNVYHNKLTREMHLAKANVIVPLVSSNNMFSGNKVNNAESQEVFFNHYEHDRLLISEEEKKAKINKQARQIVT